MRLGARMRWGRAGLGPWGSSLPLQDRGGHNRSPRALKRNRQHPWQEEAAADLAREQDGLWAGKRVV